MICSIKMVYRRKQEALDVLDVSFMYIKVKFFFLDTSTETNQSNFYPEALLGFANVAQGYVEDR